MSKQQLSEINAILQKINERVAGLNLSGEHIPMIERDILLAHLRDLYEAVGIIEGLNTIGAGEAEPEESEETPVAEVPEVHTEPVNTPVAEVSEVHPEPESTPADTMPEIVEEEEEFILESEHEEETEDGEFPQAEYDEDEIEEEAPELTMAETPIQAEDEPEPAIVAHKPVEAVAPPKIPTEKKSTVNERKETTSIYDKLSSKKVDTSIAKQHTLKPISDLKQAIDLNDSFGFIRELFHGKAEEYRAAIAKLNTFSHREEAMTFFSDLQTNYRWSDDSPEFEKLADLVSRRYLN